MFEYNYNAVIHLLFSVSGSSCCSFICSCFNFSRPVGMVVAPLCWKANEWIGLAVGCQTSEILRSLRNVFQGSAFENESGSGGEEYLPIQLAFFFLVVCIIFALLFSFQLLP